MRLKATNAQGLSPNGFLIWAPDFPDDPFPADPPVLLGARFDKLAFIIGIKPPLICSGDLQSDQSCVSSPQLSS